MPQVAAISQQIWDMKYRLKGPDGQPVDKTIEESWRRVALALAEPESQPQVWAPRFLDAMTDFKVLPAGRILAGAGTARQVTLFNCFVMGTIPDDMSGIFTHLREAALTMQQGGGIGYDFSTLRPKGAPVKGVGADASGPLSFMDVWDAMCRTIMSAGHRRGAMMATLRCDHPDIEAFIAAKREAGRLRMFNLSVLVTDAFMQAIREDGPWELKFGGTTFRVLSARALWDQIMRATFAYAEPGVIFIDRINRRNNLGYCETISATNPCVTAEGWVHTAEGPRQVQELVGRPFTALVDGRSFPSAPHGFFKTGVKPVFELATEAGFALRLTADHKVRRLVSATRYRRTFEWVPARRLRRGDRILLNDHRTAPAWSGPHGENEGYLIGLLIGNGTLQRDMAILTAWPGLLAANGGFERPGVLGVMAEAESAAGGLRQGRGRGQWTPASGGGYQLAAAAIKALADELGFVPGGPAIPAAVERSSADFARGLLKGLFDAEGRVERNPTRGPSLHLEQGDVTLLKAVQRMLLRLAIESRIRPVRRTVRPRALPAGLEPKTAPDPARLELVIADEAVPLFAERVGFADTEKSARLAALLSVRRSEPALDRYLTAVVSVRPAGSEAVFDVHIPGANAFDANGLMVHNCGEQPLPPYGACLLGSLNLAKLVKRPFEPEAELDMAAVDGLVPVAVRMMDNVTDVSRFPLEAQALEARAKRRIGLGVTGLADALIMCNARYGSASAVDLTERWMRAVRRAAYLASCELAAEKGPFPLFERERYLAGETVAELEPEIRAAIARDGIRNALVTSIAPTGTISLFADNVSSGLEPVFSFKYDRNVLMPDGSRRQEEVTDYAYRLFRKMKGETAALPDSFVDAQMLAPADHLTMQAAVQKYIDASISKTINVPADMSFESFKDVYLQAYELGCKGCTTYRPNEITGAVLEVRKDTTTAEPELPLVQPATLPAKPRDIYEAGGVVYMTRPLDRPEALPGRTYKVRWPESDHALYITLNDIIQDGRRRPFEIFVNSKNMEHYAWTVGLTRMISAVFRRGGDVSFVVEELKAVFDPRGGCWMEGRYVPSLLAAIGEVIERHMIEIGFLPDPKASKEMLPVEARLKTALLAGPTGTVDRRLRQCPKCGSAGLIRQEGCDVCTACGYSRCS